MKFQTMLLFGPPGAGKGTWGGVLKQIPGMVHFSSGDMFRALDPSSLMGELALSSIRRGELVPDEHAVALWRERMQRLIDFGEFKPDQHHLILDGLPRTGHQADMTKGDLNVKLILALDCDDRHLLVRRLYGRALIQHRVDDANEETILKRFEVYDKQTADVLSHYPPSIVRRIDVSQAPAKILLDISQALVDCLD